MNSTPPSSDTLLTFPSEYTFKIIGKASLEFETEVVRILRDFFPKMSEGAVKTKASKESHYVSLTVTVMVDSQAQLDEVYQTLSTNPNVLFML